MKIGDKVAWTIPQTEVTLRGTVIGIEERIFARCKEVPHA